MSTISNTFRLDTASARSELRSLRTELGQTDAAAEASGVAMDKIGGEDQVLKIKNVREELKSFGDDLLAARVTTDNSTSAMSDAFGRMSDEARAHLEALQLKVREYGKERAVATLDIDKTLLDEKLAAAKTELRAFAKDEAFGQFKEDMKTMGYEIDDVTRKLGGGGGSSGGGGFGAAFGSGGLAGGLGAVASNVGGLGTALLAGLPILTAFSGGLTAMLGSLGAAGLGAGAVGIGAGGVFLPGLASFGLEAKQAASGIKAGETQLKTWEAAVTKYGAQSKQAQAAWTTMNRSLPPGTTVQQLAGFKSLGTEIKKDMAPGVGSVEHLALEAGSTYKPLITSAIGNANSMTESTVGAVKEILNMMQSPQVEGDFKSLTDTFDHLAGPAGVAAGEFFKILLNTAVAAEPYVEKTVYSIEHWMEHTQEDTANLGHMRTEIGGLVKDTDAWGHTLKEGGKLLFDVFAAGRPEGTSMVVTLGHTFEKWDEWIKTNPGKTEKFFHDTSEGMSQISGAATTLLGSLGGIGVQLLPTIKAISEVIKDIGPQNMATLLELGGGAYALRGGAVGKLNAPFGMMMGGGIRTKGVVTGGGSTAAATSAIATEEAQAARGGMLSKGAGLAGDAFSYLWPMMLLQGGISAAGGSGGVGNRIEQFAHGATFGLIPVKPTGGQAGDAATEQASGFMGRLAGGSAGESALVRRYQGLSEALGTFDAGKGNVNTSQLSRILGLSHEEVQSAFEEQKGQLSGAESESTNVHKALLSYMHKLQPEVGDLSTSLIKEFGSKFKFYTEPSMFKELRTDLHNLPPTFQLQGVKAMEGLASSLEKQGKLPKGSIKQLIKDIEHEFPKLHNAMEQAGLSSMSALERTLKDDKTTKKIQADIRSIGTMFAEAGNLKDVRVNSSNVSKLWGEAMGDLKNEMTHGPKEGRERAKEAYEHFKSDSKDVTEVTTHYWENMKTSGKSEFEGLGQLITQALSNIVGQVRSTEGAMSGSEKSGHSLNLKLKPWSLSGFAGGGWVGNQGQRGGDSVHAMLGMGEAVLNGPQQAMVSAHMASGGYTGGLNGIFRESSSMKHGLPGYAGGGFVAEPGTNFSAGQEPQIVSDLRKLASLMNTTIYGISGYRSPQHSVEVGGFPNDPHTRGEAADIGIGSPSLASAAALNASILSRVGLYRPFYPASAHEINHVQLLAGIAAGGAKGGVGGLGNAGASLLIPHISGTGILPQLGNMSIDQLAKIAKSHMSGPASMAGLGGHGSGGSPNANERLGREMMMAMGWGAGEWPPLQKLWTQESGWSDTAMNNPRMGWLAPGNASGIPQADGQGDVYPYGQARPQIAWGLNYIKSKYGSPSKAWAFENSHSPAWYGGGGVVGGGSGFAGWYQKGGSFIAHGPTMVGVGEGGRERVDITPLGSSGSGGGRSVVIQKLDVHNNRKGDIRDMILAELEEVTKHLDSAHTHNPAELMR